MMKLDKFTYPVVALLLLCLLSGVSALAQQSVPRGEIGGVTDILDFPVGARAMALGGAYVSVANDPFALYWNPAALDNVSRMALGMYYTNLPGGTHYNFGSYVYPTLYTGTFSVGVLRLSTGEIDIRGADDPLKLGTLDYGRTLFLFGYGYRFADWISVGSTIKLERATFPGYPDLADDRVGSISESAFGADFGLAFYPQFNVAALRDVAVGISVQNAVKRSFRVVDVRESTPANIRFGLSKNISFNNASSLLLAFELDVNEKRYSKREHEQIPSHYHFGAEYNLMQSVLFRAGYDYRRQETGALGGQLTYGVGARVMGFELDYSYWNGWDSLLGSSHRISFVINVGKDRQQRLDELNARQMEEIRQEVIKRQAQERMDAVTSGKAEANQYFNRGDLHRAYSSVMKVLAWDRTGEDPDLEDARQLLAEINTALDARQQQEREDLISRSREEERLQRLSQTIRDHYDKANAFYMSEQYVQAIEECDRALELNPDNELVRDLRTKAEEDLKQRLNSLLQTANNLEKQGRDPEAITYYNQALPLARDYKEYDTLIRGRLNFLQNKLSFEDLVRRAYENERNKEYATAAELYRRALQYQPNNKQVQERLAETEARANARPMDMTPEVRDLYSKGFNAFQNGQFDEAIEYFEQARKLQPQNITILNALDYVQERKRRQNSGG